MNISDVLALLPKETGVLGLTAAFFTALLAWVNRRDMRQLVEAQTDAASVAALVGRIERMEGREKSHEAELADLRTRATNAESRATQLAADLVRMSGEVSRSEAVIRGLLKENRQLRRSLGQHVPSEPPPGSGS